VVEVSRTSAYVVVNETKVKVDLTKYLERHQVGLISHGVGEGGKPTLYLVCQQARVVKGA
jgi:hypothetical protein